MRSPAFDVQLIRTRDLPSAERRAAERATRKGRLHRVRSGVLVRPGALDGLRPADLHLLLIRASLPRIPPGTSVGMTSAGALHGLPHVGGWPVKVQLIDPSTSHTTITSWFERHGAQRRQPGHLAHVEGIPVTGLVRTIVDIAATEPATSSLAGIDHVLRRKLVSRTALLQELELAPPKAHARARAAIEMGSSLSDSPAESVARVRFRQLGAPEPVQQHEFVRAGERRAVVDFWFPGQGVVVEVDGRAKYGDGAASATAHWDEKRREDFVRSFPEVRTVIRFSWADLMDPEVIRVALTRAGVPVH